MAKLVDAHDSDSCGEILGGSNPPIDSLFFIKKFIFTFLKKHILFISFCTSIDEILFYIEIDIFCVFLSMCIKGGY